MLIVRENEWMPQVALHETQSTLLGEALLHLETVSQGCSHPNITPVHAYTHQWL